MQIHFLSHLVSYSDPINAIKWYPRFLYRNETKLLKPRNNYQLDTILYTIKPASYILKEKSGYQCNRIESRSVQNNGSTTDTSGDGYSISFRWPFVILNSMQRVPLLRRFCCFYAAQMRFYAFYGLYYEAWMYY